MIAEVKKLDPGALPLVRGSALAAGWDIHSCISTPILLAPNEVRLIPTGLSIAVSPGYEIQVRPRSGLALKHGVTLANAPGTIDADYRGEIKIMLINLGKDVFIIEKKMRIAQLVFAKHEVPELKWVKHLSETVRGEGGFGHTGV